MQHPVTPSVTRLSIRYPYTVYCLMHVSTYFSVPVSDGYSWNVLSHFLLEGSGIAAALTSDISRLVTLVGAVALLQYVYTSLIHSGREGKLRKTYVEGLQRWGAAHVWTALRVRISVAQTAGYKTACTPNLLRSAKSTHYRGFHVARTTPNSYTECMLHYMFIMQPTLTAIMYRHPSSPAVTCFTDTVMTVTGTQEPEYTH